MARTPVKLQPFLPGIMRAGAKRLQHAIGRARTEPLPVEALDRLERLLGRQLPAEVFLLFECPQCGLQARGRTRGSRTSAQLATSAAARVTRLIPRVPVRHWVLSLPRWMRGRLAEDETLGGAIARAFVRSIAAWQKECARKALELDGELSCGSITVIQRGGTALNLDVHVHAMVLDGVYSFDEAGEAVFHPLPEPDASDISRISMRIRKQISALIQTSRPQGTSPLLPLQRASVRHEVSTGPRAGTATPRIKGECPIATPARGKTHQSGGFSIHAAPPVPADERTEVGKLARYLTRPPLDPRRIEAGQDGKVRYRLKQPFSDGTTHVEFSPSELVEKLLSMVPSGPSQRVAYHGVLAPAAAARCKIIPGQLELIPRGGDEPAKTKRKRIRLDPKTAPKCPECKVAMEPREVEQATDWLIGA